jgi:xanthine dioxygenase
MDAPLYEREPPHFTALRAVRLPKGPDITVQWDDGSGLCMKTPPGRTLFFSNCQLYGLLSEEEKCTAENSWVEYAPYPYMWMENCKGNNNGLSVVPQGREHKMEEMPEWKEEFIKRVSFGAVSSFLYERTIMLIFLLVSLCLDHTEWRESAADSWHVCA